MQSPPTGPRGFTLIEMAIVLVVIGLIVGGVLVGRDLIKAAEVRATITRLEKVSDSGEYLSKQIQCPAGGC